MQPDSIVSNFANPQNLNRYSYVTNRPVNFNDPSGHKCAPEDDCAGWHNYDAVPVLKRLIKRDFGITMSEKGDPNNPHPKAWSAKNLLIIYNALNKVNTALNGNLKYLVGRATFKWGEHDPAGGNTTYHGLTYGTTITFYTLGKNAIREMNIFHEFGHLIDNTPPMVNVFSDDPKLKNASFVGGNGYLNPLALTDPNKVYDPTYGTAQAIQASKNTPVEQWADVFANYVAGNINLSEPAGPGIDMYKFVIGALTPYVGIP